MQGYEGRQRALAQRDHEELGRASALDRDNQEMATLLAQERQARKLAQDQIDALREQVGAMTSRLAEARESVESTAREAETRSASTRRRVGATITANNSLRDRLDQLEIEGVEKRADGDLIRIELPADRLFESGGALLRADAPAWIQQVGDEIAREFPDRIVGVEGHTDSDQLTSGRWANNHQLSVGRAMAVYDQLAARSRLKPRRMFVSGFGPNHPIVSNGTPSGKERNRRVELVVYPDVVEEP